MTTNEKDSLITVSLPLSVIKDARLSKSAAVLYAVICGLSKDGECFATNRYLGSTLNVENRTIQRLLKELLDCSYISIRTVEGSGAALKSRRIKPIGPLPRRKNTAPAVSKPLDTEPAAQETVEPDSLYPDSFYESLRQTSKIRSETIYDLLAPSLRRLTEQRRDASVKGSQAKNDGSDLREAVDDDYEIKF